MPWLDEIGYYLYGIRLLIEGRLEGLKWLDFSERGFWRSWWALAFCLPPMMLGWAGTRIYFLPLLGASAGPFFVVKLAILDIANWLLCYLALAVVMTVAGYAAFIKPMIVALNWLSVPIQWLGIAASLALIFAPSNSDLYFSILLVLLFVAAAAYFLVIRQIAGRKSLPTLAFLLTLVVANLWVTSALSDMLGLPSS